MAAAFQVKLSGKWEDYHGDEDKILKRAFLAGFPNARLTLRGQQYEVNFKAMEQKNVRTGKSRNIRPPYGWKAPSEPVCKPGPTTCITVPPGSPGTTIQVPHPKAKGQFISVTVPPSAKVGQPMLVPIPEVVYTPAAAPDAPLPAAPLPAAPLPAAPLPAAPAAVPAPASAPTPAAPAAAPKSKGYSTGAKVAMGVGGVAALGGLAVAGALLGEHIADEGWDATMAELGGALGHAGDAIGDAAGEAGSVIAHGAEAAGDWAGGAADHVGDLIMDLF